ncbi:SprT family zinc-dependent metalloprotease [Coraliomargarita algicola]|uniref:SprT family zinc-dependent metalloprotease n=1 Tax=Coraliomargarita algicola TaxID=3092156 RepID=A0ABZ0RNG1_9BACT|nr:SprT family zinc-dependent metalloprotease [Coraliomargarita sp. J2-16]WPJ97766.1 SprT family zinc-dependent metalloprotease [Coraliomargarita sp. J2-16]
MQSTAEMMEGSILYGQRVIDYTCSTVDRKTLEIAVHPDASVVVKAPAGTDVGAIEAKLRKRARWIVNQQDYFKQFNPRTPQRHYISGETHLYLGKQYQLKVSVGDANKVRLKHGVFEVSCWQKVAPHMTKRLMEQWYAQKAAEQFAQSLERCWPKIARYGYHKPSIVIQRMEKRWGSLSENGTLTLNVELVKASKECIDYVMIHELCHLKHHDHSADFYQLLAALLPEWRHLKQKLELRLA